MRVIVSNEVSDDFSNFVVVDSLKKVRTMKGVETLIIHKCSEADFDIGMFISEFYKNGVNNFIYINENPSTSLKLVLEGVHGYIYTDEFYLNDEEELKYLVEDVENNVDEETTDLAVSNTTIIKDFMLAFSRGDEKINTPLYLERVNTAVNELAALTEMQSAQLTEMGESALDVFHKASDIITSMDKQRQLLQQQLNELEEMTPTQSSRPVFGGGIMSFPSYKYVGQSKVLLIREVSPCRYLTSFLLAYEHYLHYELNKRVKLIFIHQKGAFITKKYDGFTSITQESAKMLSLYDAEIIATNNPKSDILKTLLSKQVDIFIVVDRLYGNNDIVQGRVSKLNAVGGISDLTRFKLQKSNCIFPVVKQDGAFFSIPTINGYPVEQDVRFAAYNQLCRDRFEKLDKFLQLPKD